MLELIFRVALGGVLRARVLRYERIHRAGDVWLYWWGLKGSRSGGGACGDGGVGLGCCVWCCCSLDSWRASQAEVLPRRCLYRERASSARLGLLRTTQHVNFTCMCLRLQHSLTAHCHVFRRSLSQIIQPFYESAYKSSASFLSVIPEMSGQADWQKQLTFSDRLSVISKMHVSALVNDCLQETLY